MNSQLWKIPIELGFVLSLLIPLILYLLLTFQKKEKKYYKWTGFIVYLYVILYLTLDREAGGNDYHIILMPFWSYAYFSQADYRWQIFMNIFLFIPFGFMLPWIAERRFFQTVLIGCIFSVGIEVTQYIMRFGMCEIDDVIHNTFGTAVGYGYWKLIDWTAKHYGEDLVRFCKQSIRRIKRSVLQFFK